MTHRKAKPLLFLILLTGLTGCHRNPSDLNQTFDSQRWKAGNASTRGEMVFSLLNAKPSDWVGGPDFLPGSRFVGKTSTDVVVLLGPPDSQLTMSMGLGPGVNAESFSTYSLGLVRRFEDSPSSVTDPDLIFYFDKDDVVCRIDLD